MPALGPLATLTTFLGAALLFGVQPLAARTLLPVLGGSPAVWNTAMVFFQTALLAGYAWAHLSVRLAGVRWQARMHALLALAAIALLPVTAPTGAPAADRSPVAWVLGTLAGMLGPLVVLLSANAPLVQRWFAASGHPSARDPYFLYAASNAGSLLALAAYPFVIEPRSTLAQQWRWWAVGYAVFALCTAACALLATQRADDAATASGTASGTLAERLRWLVLALVPSSLLIAVTQLVSTDIAAVPLLWVVPLGIYLLSFIVVFARRPLVAVATVSTLLPWIAVPMAVSSFLLLPGVPLPAIVGLQLVGLFVAALACHGRLAAERPAPVRLTEFYFLLALGGVLGGALAALVAPVVFSWVAEYPLALVAACLLRLPRHPRRAGPDLAAPLLVGSVFFGTLWAAPRVGITDPWWHAAWPYLLAATVALLLAPRVLGFGLALATLFGLAQLSPEDSNRTVHRARTFFGVHRVVADPDGVWHSLAHGVTEHGRQARVESLRRIPMMYYHPAGPLGAIFRAWRDSGSRGPVGVVGLGTGAIAAYLRAGERLDFFEIDPEVVRIARTPALFTYLADSAAEIRIVLGDARLRLGEAQENSYDLLILDAFSSDAIPVHLLTVEALQTYRRTLRPSGIMAAHVTNRHFDLVPVLGAGAAAVGLDAIWRGERELAAAARARGREPSTWVVLAAPQSPVLATLATVGWAQVPATSRPPWTDDHVDLVGTLRPRG